MAKAITAKKLVSLLEQKKVDDRNSVNLYASVGGELYPITGVVLNKNDGILTTEVNDIEGDEALENAVEHG